MLRQLDAEFSPHQGPLQLSTLLILSMCLTLMMIMVDHLTILALFNVILFAVFIGHPVCRKLIRPVSVSILLLVYGISFSQSLFFSVHPQTIWMNWGQIDLFGNVYEITFSIEGAIHGALISFKLIPPLLMSFLIVYSTSMIDILSLIRRFRVPLKFMLLMITAIRLIPISVRQIQEQHRIQRMFSDRSRRFRPIQRIRWEIRLITTTILYLLNQSSEITMALMSRSVQIHDVDAPVHLSSTEKWLIRSMISITVSLILIQIFYYLYIWDWLTMTDLRSLYEFKRTYL